MDQALQPFEDPILTGLLDRERNLQTAVNEMDRSLSGLRDVDLTLQLAAVRLEVANRLLEATRLGQTDPRAEERLRPIRDRAGSALRCLEELRASNVSEEQKSEVFQGPRYAELKAALQEFVLRGGGALLEPQQDDERRSAAVARAITAALRKVGGSDSDSPPAFRTERLPGFLRGLVNTLLPVLAPENQQDPPYGIPEGQETLHRAEKIKMPLSQAIHYLETELLPRLEQEVAAAPGDRTALKGLRIAQERLREYRGIHMRPRATPINLEQGFYTDWLTQYTADGELLVSINLPVRFRSGTNLDRIREAMQQEVVRRLAGRGISEHLDREYRYRRSLASGRRGSSRVPSQKLDFAACFGELRTLYPALNRLEDNRELRKMLDTVQGSGRRAAERAIKALLARGGSDLLQLP